MTILDDAAALVAKRLGDQLSILTIERLVVGLFFTGVKLSNGRAGVSYTAVKEIPDAVCCPTSFGKGFDPTRLCGTPAQKLLDRHVSSNPIRTGAAIAALNALSATCFEAGLDGGYRVEEGVDALDTVEIPEGATVVLVGAMVPAIRRIKAAGVDYWILEKDPRTLKGDELAHYAPAEKSGEIVPRADVLIATAATMVTESLEPILKAARPDAAVTVLGPTAGFVPEPLFERGVDVVGGLMVKQADELLDLLASGGSGYHFFGSLSSRTVIRR
jgi:uncharacterized protein (DUF4213/DUF364 family)